MGVSRECRDFVLSLVAINPHERICASEALSHPWFARSVPVKRSKVARQKSCQSLKSLQHPSHSKAQRMCSQVMSWSLSQDKLQELDTVFTSVDVDSNGCISVDEVRGALETLSLETDTVKGILSNADDNGDGVITYTEFLSALTGSMVDKTPAMIQDTFRRFDVDGSGWIGVEELREVIGEHIGEEDLDAIIHAIDSSGDGQITFGEFLDFVQSDHHEQGVFRAAVLKVQSALRLQAGAHTSHGKHRILTEQKEQRLVIPLQQQSEEQQATQLSGACGDGVSVVEQLRKMQSNFHAVAKVWCAHKERQEDRLNQAQALLNILQDLKVVEQRTNASSSAT